MQNKKIIIAGGSGFIGRELCKFFSPNNEVIILGRQVINEANNTYGENALAPEDNFPVRHVMWDGIRQGDWTKEIEGAHLIINLAGKSVNCRYTQQNKRAIMDSRINATNAIGLAIRQATHPPLLWINAGSATIYPHATDRPRDEQFTDFSDDFSVQVCKEWERAFYDNRTPFTRICFLRLAITLGNGGVMVPYFNLLKFGLGGQQGNGQQMYSWIHIDDVCHTIAWLAGNDELEGTFNCSSPEPVTNAAFMRTLRTATGTIIGLPAFTWMLRVGAFLIGTETELILKSRWVLPTRLLGTGYQFRYPALSTAIENIIAVTPRKRYRMW